MTSISNHTTAISISPTQSAQEILPDSTTEQISLPSNTQHLLNVRPVALPHVQNREELQRQHIIDEQGVITAEAYHKIGDLPHISFRENEKKYLTRPIPLVHSNGTEMVCLTGLELSEKFLKHIHVATYWQGKNVPFVNYSTDLFIKGLTRIGANVHNLSSTSRDEIERITILCFIKFDLNDQNRQEIIKSCAQFLTHVQNTRFKEEDLSEHGFRLLQISDDNLMVVEFGNVKTKTGPAFQLVFGAPKRLGLDAKDSLFAKFNFHRSRQPVSTIGIPTWQAIFDCELHYSHISNLDAMTGNDLIKILIDLAQQETYMPWDKAPNGLHLVIHKLCDYYLDIEGLSFAILQLLADQERVPLTFLISQYLIVDARSSFCEWMFKDYESKNPFFQKIQELMTQKEMPLEKVNAFLHHAALVRLQEPSTKLESGTGIQIYREKEAGTWKVVYCVENYTLKLPLNIQEANDLFLKTSEEHLQQLKALWEAIVPADYKRSPGISPFLETVNLIPHFPKNLAKAASSLLEHPDPFMKFLGFRLGIAALSLNNSGSFKVKFLTQIPFLLDQCEQKTAILNETCLFFDLPSTSIPENASLKELQWMWIQCLCHYEKNRATVIIDENSWVVINVWEELFPALSQEEIHKYFLHFHSVFLPVIGSTFLIRTISSLPPATCIKAIRALIAAQRLDAHSLAGIIKTHLLQSNNLELLEKCLIELRALYGFPEVVEILSKLKAKQDDSAQETVSKDFISSQYRQTFEALFCVKGKKVALELWNKTSLQSELQEDDLKACSKLVGDDERLFAYVFDDQAKLESFKNRCAQNHYADILNDLSKEFIPPSSTHYEAYQQVAITYFDTFCRKSFQQTYWQMGVILKLMETAVLASACREEKRLIFLIQFFLNLKKPAGERATNSAGSYEKLALDLQEMVTKEVVEQGSLSLTCAWVELVKMEIADLKMDPKDQLKVYERLQKSNRVDTLFDLLKLAKYPHDLIDPSIVPIYLWAFKEMLNQKPTSWHSVQAAMMLCRKNKTLYEKPFVHTWMSLHVTLLPQFEELHDWLLAIQSVVNLVPAEELPQVVMLLQKEILELPFEKAYPLFKAVYSKLNNPGQVCLEILKKEYGDERNATQCGHFLQSEVSTLSLMYQDALMPFIHEKLQYLLNKDMSSLEVAVKIIELYEIKDACLWLELLRKLQACSSKQLQDTGCQAWKKCAPKVPSEAAKESCWLLAIECGIRSETDTFLTEACDNTWVSSIFSYPEKQIEFYKLLFSLVPQFPESNALDWSQFTKFLFVCESIQTIRPIHRELSSETLLSSLYTSLEYCRNDQNVEQIIFYVMRILNEELPENKDQLEKLVLALLKSFRKILLDEQVCPKISALISALTKSSAPQLKEIKQKLMKSRHPLANNMALDWMYNEFKATQKLDEHTVPFLKRILNDQKSQYGIHTINQFLETAEFREQVRAVLWQKLRLQSVLYVLKAQRSEQLIKDSIIQFIKHYSEIRTRPDSPECIMLAFQNLFILLFKYRNCIDFANLQKSFFDTLLPEEQNRYKMDYVEVDVAKLEDRNQHTPFIFSTVSLYLRIMIANLFPKSVLVQYLHAFALYCVMYTFIDKTKRRIDETYNLVKEAYQKQVFTDSPSTFLKCYLILGGLLPAQLDPKSQGQQAFSHPSNDNLVLQGFPSEKEEIQMVLDQALEANLNADSNIFIETAQELIAQQSKHALWKAIQLMITFNFTFSTKSTSRSLESILTCIKRRPDLMWDIYQTRFFFKVFNQALVKSPLFLSTADNKDRECACIFSYELIALMLQKPEAYPQFTTELLDLVCSILMNAIRWRESSEHYETLINQIISQLSAASFISEEDLLLLLEKFVSYNLIEKNSSFYKKLLITITKQSVF